MRGAGIDSTDLFNEVHKWVNFQNMLKEYLVGYLVQAPATTLQVPGQASLNAPRLSNSYPSKQLPIATSFAYDSYQTERCYTLIVYGKVAKCNKIKSCYFYGTVGNDFLTVIVHCLQKQFKLSLELHANIKKFDIRKTNLKFELVLYKEINGMWPNEGKHKPQSKTTTEKSNLEYFQAKCIENTAVSHDSRLVTFEFLGDFYAIPPLGSHVFVYNNDKDSLIDKKPYTVFNVIDSRRFQLLVKKYENGILSSYICALKPDEIVEMQGFDHFIDMNVLLKVKSLVILAAGTGITPFYRIMKEISTNQNFNEHSCTLMFYNKKKKDILIPEELDQLKNGIASIEITHALSQEDAEMWDGLSGRINSSHLDKFSNQSIFLICGPAPFVHLAAGLLKEKSVSKANIKEFVG